MAIHFSPDQLNRLNQGQRPAGLAGAAAIAQDEINARLAHARSGISAQQLAAFAAKVRRDPLLMRKLGARVYELMTADLAAQRERDWHYGARR